MPVCVPRKQSSFAHLPVDLLALYVTVRHSALLDSTPCCSASLRCTKIMYYDQLRLLSVDAADVVIYRLNNSTALNLHCTAPYNTIIHYTYSSALHCTALRRTALHCAALRCAALRCAALCCAALRRAALHCTALHCAALRCTALRCTALRCTTLQVVCCSTSCCIGPCRKAARDKIMRASLGEVPSMAFTRRGNKHMKCASFKQTHNV